MIAFRRFERDDFPLLLEWFGREHVARWWYDEPTTIEEMEREYGAVADGSEPTEAAIVLLDGRPVGYVQSYRAADYAELWPVDAPPGSWGVDLLIGEADLIGRGLGPEILRAYAARLFEDPEVEQVIAAVEVANERSLRAFAKAGFVDSGRTLQVGDARAPERLLVLRRE